jgi:hypothetical protein
VGFNPPWAWQSAWVKPPETNANSLSLLAWLSVGSATAVAGVLQNAIVETHAAVIAVPASTRRGCVFIVASVGLLLIHAPPEKSAAEGYVVAVAERTRDRLARVAFPFVAVATFAVLGWGVQLLWVHYSDPIASARIKQCRAVTKGVKCTGGWRSADGSEKTVHIDDGDYFLPGALAWV